MFELTLIILQKATNRCLLLVDKYVMSEAMIRCSQERFYRYAYGGNVLMK